MKIRALQVGGMLGYSVADTSRARQPRGQESAQHEPEAAATKTEDDGLLSKDILKELMDKGLSNDVDAFLAQLSKIKQTSINPKQAEQLLIKQYSDLNKVIQNKANFTHAITEATKRGGLGEMAITSNGQILVENQETG
jgi:hypothetical protein